MIWTRFLTGLFFILAAVAGVIKICVVAIDFRKRYSFKMYAYLLMACLFSAAMIVFAIGYLCSLGYVVSTGFFMAAFWAIGNIWIQFADISVPKLSDKIVLYLITFVPLSPFLVFLVRWSFTAPLGINFNTQLIWLNLVMTAGAFLVWLVSFFASRLRSSYMFWTVSFFFYAMAALVARLQFSEIWILASSILYLSGTLAYIYMWVNHGQNS